jgi:hypothetical protein
MEEGGDVAYDEDLADRVRAVLPHGEAVTEPQIFGGLAFMLGGYMFCGIVKDALMVRLGPEAPTAAWASRTSGRWTSPAGLHGDALRQWVEDAAVYARGLPPKRATASAHDLAKMQAMARRVCLV